MRFENLKICSCGLVISANLNNHKKSKRHAYLLKKQVIGKSRLTNQYQIKFRNRLEDYFNIESDEDPVAFGAD
jgi:hypothetical protein